jgi:4-hydroxythreonine-4-phosphate dehydrogenase
VLGITLGDPAGIGPEIAVKAAYGTRWPADVRLVLIGSSALIRAECRRQKRPAPAAGKVSLFDPVPGPPISVAPGRCTVRGARLAVRWIEAGVDACLAGTLDGLVTGPINKEGLHRAGVPFPGHTELLAARTGTDRFAMLLVGGPLRVVLATRHVQLAQVPRRLTAAGIVETATLMAEALPWLGVRRGTIGVCALNPHAGDGGTLGDEERRVIAPALRVLQRRGVPVEGPVPADVVFHQAVRGRYAAVLAMYHDQGLAPLKMLAFETGVNITLGLPIVRTSPDHGTAYDIAGRGRANPASLVEAIRLAAELARRPNPWARAAGSPA